MLHPIQGILEGISLDKYEHDLIAQDEQIFCSPDKSLLDEKIGKTGANNSISLFPGYLHNFI